MDVMYHKKQQRSTAKNQPERLQPHCIGLTEPELRAAAGEPPHSACCTHMTPLLSDSDPPPLGTLTPFSLSDPFSPSLSPFTETALLT